MNSKKKKIAVAALSVTMAATLAAGQVIAFAAESRSNNIVASASNVVEGTFSNLTGKLDLSDIARQNLSDSVVDYGEEAEVQTISGTRNSNETLIISLDVPSIADCIGEEDISVAEFLATSAGKKALSNITASQNALLGRLSSAGIYYTEVGRYTTVLNAVAVEVNTAQFSKIKSMHGVGMVGVSKTYQAMDTVGGQVNPSNVYGTGIYDTSDCEYDGSGITVAILDTGIDYTHDAFSHEPDEVAFEKSHIEEVLDSLAAKRLSPNVTAENLYLSAKIPFAYDYADKDDDVYPSYSQHGVHVAGIVAGKDDYWIDKDGHQQGEKDSKYDFLGAAPEAQLVVCKVFTDDLESDDLGGATSEDIIAALDDCATLGVDIVNMSLGTTSGFSNLSIDGDEEGRQLRTVYQKLKDRGISLIAAAGNEYSSGFGSNFGTNLASNPDSGTVGSPSTFVGALSVASINGLPSPFLLANANESGKYSSTPIYYYESNDSNSVPFDFAEEMLGDKESATFTYLVIPGYGAAGDYSKVRDRLQNKGEGEKIIVVVKRGTSNFKDKVEIAYRQGADGIIVYNNVAGTIRMSLGDIDEKQRIPAISINMDAGTALTVDPNNPTKLRTEGRIEINRNYQAGPFMNDYSSWGATPDLKLKPDITSHGGEITSTVSGGYEQMSGTSMATPNLAGLMALVRAYLKDKNESLTPVQLTTLANQIVMSSATLLYDEESLPYSPRKQGAGLATLDNIFNTKAYLSTEEGVDGGTEDNRPKIELKDDADKKGVYNFKFKLTNFGSSSLKFKLVSRFMTETIASDRLAVAEAAYMLDDIPAEFSVDGASFNNGEIVIDSNKTATISVRLTLSSDEKNYIDTYFVNGMYVEGFISLESLDENDNQCDLNLPFMGFYGDWEAAPMLDYDAYEMSAIKQDTSMTEEEKPHESIFATQLYSTYYNGRYAVPMGGFAYLQDEDAEQVYVTEEHCSISRFNDFYGATSMENYLTSTGLRCLYAGLLRNAELVTYDIYNANTGEMIYQGTKYRVGKGYAGGGSAVPGLVELKLDSDELGLINNGKYTIQFKFYMKAEDKDNGNFNPENSFTSNFYIDYDSPVLQASRLRYYDYTEGNKTKQRIYLDLDIYDNHYPQSILLCYSDEDYDSESDEVPVINMATEFVTPIYNPERNTTNTVSIEITDIYEKYRNRLYVQVDDYSLNHSVYNLNFDIANQANQSSDEISFVTDGRLTATTSNGATRYELTIEQNEAYTVGLNCGSSNASNYSWTTMRSDIVKVKNNEIFGVKPGKDVRVMVEGSNGKSIVLYVTVVESSRTLQNPSVSFGPIVNSALSITNPGPGGTVRVNAGQTFKLEIEPDPWYFPINELNFEWTSSNEDIATVASDGTVTTNNKRGTTIISASAERENGSRITSVVTLSVADPFTIENMTLSHYYGSEETVIIPSDKNVMYIGEEAFEDNDTMKKVVIPKTVTEISERAFLNCTALEEVYFIEMTEDENATPVLDLAAINLILADAFQGCESLRLLDLTNVKVVTVGGAAFANCANLEEIRHMEKIGIADSNAFKGCTSLKKADITGLHTAGYNVFEGCTDLTSVVTDHYSAIGVGMFYGCTSLQSVTIKSPRVSGEARFGFGDMSYGGGAFENCTSLSSVKFEISDSRWNDIAYRIDAYAFRGCEDLSNVDFGTCKVSYIGDNAFADTNLTAFTMPAGDPVLGDHIFGSNSNVEITWNGCEETEQGVYRDNVLLRAPATIGSGFTIKAGTTGIGTYAFSDSTFEEGVTLIIPESVTKIGEGAFANRTLKSVQLPDGLTAIPAYAFMNSGITEIKIPDSVDTIGDFAFYNCDSLATVTFGNSPSLSQTGNYAFAGTAISSIKMPVSVETMGNYTFANCESLDNAELPAVQSLGERTFEGCINLTKATFGQSAKASGNYTFFPGILRYDTDQDTKILFPVYKASKLTTVDLGGLTEIGEAAFWHCDQLTSVDLKGVKVIGDAAFMECTGLAEVKKLENVTDIGDNAFMGAKLVTINLAKAKNIGEQAFYDNRSATTVDIPAAVDIGNHAFANTQISTISLPASLEKLGNGAFMSTRMYSITLADGNETFFLKDNVLYRNIKDTGTTEKYELVMYPTMLNSMSDGTNNHYRVIDGTVSIQAYAFAYAGSGLKTVTLPYSLKTIGECAFYQSNVTRYNFESINAPTLLSEFRALVINGMDFRSLYYANFRDEFMNYWSGVVQNDLTIGRPSNGIGYDNYVYTNFFTSTVDLGELMDDNTRDFVTRVEGFYDIDTINSWMSLEVNNENKDMVSEFSENVKAAHLAYYNILSEKQLEFAGAERYQKLIDTESALKPVKQRFGIPLSVARLSVHSSSTYKKDYNQGDKFEIEGLVLEITYDDYSTEILTDTSLMSVNSQYLGELTTLNTYVVVSYGGQSCRVLINVTDNGTTDENGGDGQQGGNCAGCGTMDIGSTLGGTGLLLLTMAGALLLVKRLHRKADKN